MKKLKQRLPTKQEVKKRIRNIPVWGWPIIVLILIIGIILGSTIFIWVPGTTIISLLIGIGFVEWLDKKIPKKQKKISK